MSNIIVIKNSYKDENSLKDVMDYCAGNNFDSPKCSFMYGVCSSDGSVDTAVENMMEVKEQYRKTGGKQLWHLVVTINTKTNSTNENYLLRKKRMEDKECDSLVSGISDYINSIGYQNCVFRHIDTNVAHMHIVVNSVSYMNGKKLTDVKSFVYGIKNYALHHHYINLGNVIYREGYRY